MGLALASGGSVLELAGTGSIGHTGSFWQLLTEATPVAPPATKTLPHKPNTLLFVLLQEQRVRIVAELDDQAWSC